MMKKLKATPIALMLMSMGLLNACSMPTYNQEVSSNKNAYGIGLALMAAEVIDCAF